MPNNMMIKEGEIIENNWKLITSADELSAEGLSVDGNVLVSLELWQAHKVALSARVSSQSIGLWLKNDQCVSTLVDELNQFAVIAIDFPVFMDGRGFSIARLLRDRYAYIGELRATGAVIRDQLCYLKRCGFNAFDLDESIDLEAALASLNDFSEAYQTSADQQTPLFRRRG
jgi:uncharacterized protein (DUF934 family)